MAGGEDIPDSRALRKSGSRLAGLDMLRGIAAMWVLAYHLGTIRHVDLGLAAKGYLSVDFFFVLSGYVMARTYETRFGAGHGAARFLWARYRRLWPVMAAGALIGAPMLASDLADPGLFAIVAAANLLLVPVFLGSGSVFPINSVAWSVFAELWANLIHALLLSRLPTRALAGFTGMLVMLLAGNALAHGGLDQGAGDSSIHIGVLRAVTGYSLGVLLWRWWGDEPAIAVPPLAAFLAIPAIVIFAPATVLASAAFDIAFAVIVSPLLIAGGLRHRGNGAVAHWLGALSFPLYAVHLPLLYWSKGLGLPPLAGVIAALLLAAYIAWRTTPAPRKPASTPAPEIAGLLVASS